MRGGEQQGAVAPLASPWGKAKFCSAKVKFCPTLVLSTKFRHHLPLPPEGYHLSVPAVPEGGTHREPGDARAAGRSKAVEPHP